MWLKSAWKYVVWAFGALISSLTLSLWTYLLCDGQINEFHLCFLWLFPHCLSDTIRCGPRNTLKYTLLNYPFCLMILLYSVLLITNFPLEFIFCELRAAYCTRAFGIFHQHQHLIIQMLIIQFNSIQLLSTREHAPILTVPSFKIYYNLDRKCCRSHENSIKHNAIFKKLKYQT